MKTYFYLYKYKLVSFIFFCLITSCRFQRSAIDIRLNQAEILMDSMPDSSYHILSDRTIFGDISHFTDDQKAHYALLYSQAQRKNYVFETNDSLISIAVAHYQSRSTSLNLIKSLHYQSIIYSNNNEDTRSIVPAMKAYELSLEIGDSLWRAKTAEFLAGLYSRSHNYNESFKFSHEATELYKKLGMEEFYLFSLVDMAVDCITSKRFDEGLCIIDTVLNHSDNSVFLRRYAYDNAMSLYLGKKDFYSANLCADTLISLYGTELPSNLLALIGTIKISNGDKSGNKFIEEARHKVYTRVDSIIYFDAIKELCVFNGDWQSAYVFQDSLINLVNEEMTKERQQTLVSRLRDYYSHLADSYAKQIRRDNYIFFGLICIVILIILIGTFAYLYMKRSRDLKISNNMNQIMALNSEIQSITLSKENIDRELQRSQIDLSELSSVFNNQKNKLDIISNKYERIEKKHNDLSEKIQIMMHNHFVHLNILISEYVNTADSDENYRSFYKNIKREIEKVQSPKFLREVTAMVDDCNEGVISRIHDSFPFFNERDLNLLALSMAGFNGGAIGMFLNMHTNSTYRRRKQIVDIITKSEVSDKEFFLNKLYK